MSPLALFALGTLWLLSRVGTRRINTIAGPFIAYTHSFYPCESDGSAVIHARATHFNPLRPYDLQILTGNFTFKEDVQDDAWTIVDMAVRSNNEWKENAFIFNFPKKGCSDFREHVPTLWRIIAKYSGAPMDKAVRCVIPKGFHDVKNEPANWTWPHFPIMPYGRYRFRVRTKFGGPMRGTPSFCLQVDCQTIPKP